METKRSLSLRVQSAQHLSTHANAAFCTVFVWNNSSPGGPAQSAAQPKYTNFSNVREDESVEWNEEVQVDVTNLKSEVLTVRVKDSSDALVGSCNIYLAHLRPGEALDQWFQLHPAGHIHLKLVLNPSQRSVPTPVNAASPYSTDFQALLELEMAKRAAMANQSPPPSNITTFLEMQNKANENARLMIAQQLQQQQQATRNFMMAQSAGYPTSYPPAHPSANNFQGTAANISTFANNLQQPNGNNSTGVGANGLGAVASIGLGALGLGPLAPFFGS